MAVVEPVRTPPSKARKHFALHCRRFIEELPRIRLYEEERTFNRQISESSHFDSARDGVIVPRQLEIRSPDGRLRVVQIGRSNPDLAVRLPDDWGHRRYGTKIFWYLSSRRTLAGRLFEAMLYGEIQAALRVRLNRPVERVDITTREALALANSVQWLKFRDLDIPVDVKTRYRDETSQAWVMGSIAGWETHLLCDRCFQ
jgi:hypothetical protein